jgi:hypothetical protein
MLLLRVREEVKGFSCGFAAVLREVGMSYYYFIPVSRVVVMFYY